jgi:hypothetical protein
MATINGTFNSLIGGTISGTVGTPGPQGPAGPAGSQGIPGVGVPAGGLEGQVLLKATDVSYDTAWFDNYAATVQATVRNETGATLTKGTVVYISGGSGNKPLVSKASASTEASSSKTFAILAADIPTNSNGQAVTLGLLKGLDTSTFTAGANLWLSVTPGQIVSPFPPASPAHAVFLGNVVRVHATQGEIEVRIQNGLELGELHDVLLTAPTNGQVLKYDSTSGLWVNGTDVGGVAWGGITGTLSAQTDLQTALDGKYSTSNPSGFQTASQVTSALAPYLLSATAASTYQTLAGMSSYLTTSAAASTYQTLSGMSSYLTTSAAASTYQTLSGMSSYLTTSAAASTYLTQSNAASTYFTIASADGKANLSGATFSGKVNFTSVSGASGLNVGIGGTAVSSPTAGDLWIATGGSILNYRDGAAVHRLVAVQNLTNTFSSPQIIDTTNSTPALRVTQKGTGDAIRVEDDTTPDATRFTVDQFGKVGIGVAPDATAALKVDTNGIMFGDGTVQTTATLQGPQGIQGEQGIPGDPGAQGTSLDVRGAWDGTTSYSEGDIVIYGGFAYVASFPNYNDVPPGSAWTVLTETVPGPQGPQGPPGEIPEAPVDGNHYVRKDGAWVQCTVVSIFDSNTYTSYNCLTV